MSDRLYGPTGPHEVSERDVDTVVYYTCLQCGAPLETDGDGFWHRDPTLNPSDDELDAGPRRRFTPRPTATRSSHNASR